MKRPHTAGLLRAVARAGLEPLPFTPQILRHTPGRPPGSRDSRKRITRSERLELHAALMRELYGGIPMPSEAQMLAVEHERYFSMTMAEYDRLRNQLEVRRVLDNEEARSK